MDTSYFHNKLEELGSEQNRKVYPKHGAPLPLFGVSFADLKSLKKEVLSEEEKKGKNQSLAEALWNTTNTDCRTFALMIAEANKISKTTLNRWIKESNYQLLSDSLGGIIAQTSFADDYNHLIKTEEEMVARTGCALINYYALKDSSKTDEFFFPYITYIEDNIHIAPNRAKEGMNNCLIAIGGRSEKLKEIVFKAADKIGKVVIDHGDTSCQTFEIKPYIERIWKRKKA